MYKMKTSVVVIMTAIALSACGGGGGGGSSAPAPTQTTQNPTPTPVPTPTPTPVSSDLQNDCVGSNCGSNSTTAYLGSGAGIWTYNNVSGSNKTLNLGVSGLSNNNVSVVLTNATDNVVALPTGSGVGSATQVSMSQIAKSQVAPDEAMTLHKESLQAQYVSYVNHNFKEYLANNQRKYTLAYNQMPAVTKMPAVYNVNDSLVFKTSDTGNYSPVTTTLKAKGAMTNGGTAYIWVENAEMAKLDQSQIDNLLSDFATAQNNIVTKTTALVGDYWGNQIKASNQSMFLDGTEKDIHIVITNLTPDGQPFGTIGYFWALNNIKAGQHPASNGKLMFYIDSETLAYNKAQGKASSGYTTVVTTLAHEFQHMIHFYQKNAIYDVQDDSWTDEMSSLMVEDVIGAIIVGVNGSPVSKLGGRFDQWLSNTECEVETWYGNTASANGCDLYNSYATHAAFGAFLTRQFGLDMVKKIVQTDKVGKVAVEKAVQSVNAGVDLAQVMRKFYASAYVNDTTIAGYGFPATSNGAFSVEAIIPSTYTPVMRSYTVLPSVLKAHASISMLKGKKTGSFTDSITIPNGVSVTMIVK